jgi:hypothetical protein
MKKHTSTRSHSEIANPAAGPLFTSGKNAQADIVCETGGISGRCGTACTGSLTNWCC